MGLTAALGIGRSALTAYQAALTVVGQNIANVATPGYTRTSARLTGVPGAGLSVGQLGSGVQLDSVRRAVNESLNARLRLAGADQQSALAERNSLLRVESIFDPLGEFNLGSLIDTFFQSLGDLQNTPDDIASRGIVINNAQALAERIHGVRRELVGHREELNADIEQLVLRADDIATRIADLNVQIASSEASTGGPAAALRDERDRLLAELSESFAVTTREQPSGAVNVFIGSAALVQFGQSFGLKTTTEINSQGLSVAVVRFKIDNGQVKPPSGGVEGLINARDTHVGGQLTRLDALAGALINEINKLHAGGQGLKGFAGLTGQTAVVDPTLALNAIGNGIFFSPKTGSFFIDVKDASGAIVRTQINVDLDGIGADTTLNALAADINANVPNVTATVLADGRLQLSAAGGTTLTFADDTSGVLASLGLNTLFSGHDALTIGVSALVASDPALLAAAKAGLSGDGSNATALANLKDQAVAVLGGASLSEYYNATVSHMAVSGSAARSAMQAADIIFDSLTAQRESISGVNLDEEAVSLISYQRAYEGAARYMNVVDEMLQVLLSLVR
jgi:flagellar hook-associated protein 1 FlgK